MVEEANSFKLVPVGKYKFAKVDTEDFEHLSKFKWYPTKSTSSSMIYARCWTRKSNISMHRLIMSCPEGMVVDHINRNPLDNRRCNLRICTHAQNMCNRGKSNGFLGVCQPKCRPTFIASIRREGEEIRLGSFRTAKHAAIAYDHAAKRFHGEFANLNFPDIETTDEMIESLRLRRGQWRKESNGAAAPHFPELEATS